MLILGYLGVLLTGVSLGLIGGGGSILIVPVLVYLFQVPPALATAYSLFAVGAASLVGAGEYARKKLVDYKTAVVFAVPSFLGVFVARRFVVPALPQEIVSLGDTVVNKDMLIMLVFAIVMLLASFSMIRKKPQAADDEQAVTGQYNYPLIGLEGLLVGALTGFVGAGGGFLIIPALVILAKIPMKLAIGTSLVIISAKSLLGFLGDVSSGQSIDWPFLLGVTGIAVVGIFGGSYISKFVPGKKLQPIFGWFVFVMGLYIITRQVLG